MSAHEVDEAESLESGWVLLFAAWLLATVSALGSLFFSEVMELPPCSLCWYQRICLFPLVLILPAGLFPYDAAVVRYAAPLTVAGWLLAAYQNLLILGIIPESAAPCARGVSCTEETFALFGIFSIPVLALLSFSAILTLLFLLHRRGDS